MPTYPYGYTYTFFSEMYQPKKYLIANSNNGFTDRRGIFCDICTVAGVVVGHFSILVMN